MKRLLFLLPLLLLFASPARAQFPNAQGWCEAGAQNVITSGLQSSTLVQASFPQCTVSVSVHGGGPATIFSNDSGTPLSNPFTATTNGQWQFFAAAGSYDITLTCSGSCVPPSPSPFPITLNEVNVGIGGGGGGSGCTLSSGSIGQLLYQNGTSTCIPAPGILTPDGNNLITRGPDPQIDIRSYMPVGGCANDNTSASPMAGTISSGSANLALNFDSMPANGCGIFIANAGPVSTVGIPSQGAAPNPTINGPAGSTTVHYKLAAIDPLFGTSAASSAIAVTTAPSTRTPTDYVTVYWTSESNAIGYLVYSDLTGGGTYVPAGYSFNCSQFSAGGVCAFIDKGAETFTWLTSPPLWPTTPPAAATNQALTTTVVSGVPGTSLVLAATATNTATAAFAFADNAPFIKSALQDAAASGPGGLDKGTVFIPKGVWNASTLPYPASGVEGIHVKLSGALFLFGLPIFGELSGGGGSSGDISIDGDACGNYNVHTYVMSGCVIEGSSYLGLLAYTGGGGSLDLRNLNLLPVQSGILINSLGAITETNVANQFPTTTTGIMAQIDANSFFHQFNHANWNLGANGNNDIPAIWLIGTTSNGHISFIDFMDNSFIGHTIRVDFPYPVGGGDNTIGLFTFTGNTSIENNWDIGLINISGTAVPQSITIDNVTTGDPNVTQAGLIYDYNGFPPSGVNTFIKGQTQGFNALLGGSASPASAIACRNWTEENPNSGGSSFNSIGFWGSYFGSYDRCDTGITRYGYDVQTSEVLTSGGNDTSAPAGEEMIGHVFQRPYTTLANGGSGSLAAATYYVRVALLDVAGRLSASSPEVSFAAGASSAINVSAVTGIYFPASCNVYFGTTPGGEANYFNSTTVTNGTCTYTLTTTAGETAGTPPPVGNAMNAWLTEENNANSCLFCGTSNGGSGSLGYGLNATQYAVMAGGTPGFYMGKLTYFMSGIFAPSLATPGTITGAICRDPSGNFLFVSGSNCFTGSSSGTVSGQAAGVIPLATGPLAIGAQSHCDDGNTTASTVTCTEPFAATSFNKLNLVNNSVGFQILGGTTSKTFRVNNSLTLAGTDGDTLTVGNSLTLAGTDGTTMTFPSVSSAIPAKICSQVAIAMSTSAIGSAAKSSAPSTGACTGATSADTISCTPSVEIFTVTGFTPSTSGILTMSAWPTANTINVEYENNTTGTITPGALTVNCNVWR